MMKTFAYRKIDAFTANGSAGNPAACLYLRQGQTLTDAEMLDIARQHKGFVSEVAYCEETEPLSYRLTYYSSECEVDFCGHATIACMYALLTENAALGSIKSLEIATRKKGMLTVFNEIEKQNAVLVKAPAPVHLGTGLDARRAVQALGLEERAVSADRPIDLIDAGLRTLIVPLRQLGETVRAAPDEQALKAFCLSQDVDIVLIYSLEVESADSLAHTRVFAPRFGYLEDPATGSGNSAFGYYLLKNRLWDGHNGISVEQGGIGKVFNRVRLAARNGTVLFGGEATVRIAGEYYV